MTKAKYKVEGMYCSACEGKVESLAKSVPGVLGAKVNLLDNTLEVDYEGPVNDEGISRALKSSGYHAVRFDDDVAKKKEIQRRIFRKEMTILIVSAALLIVLMYFSFAIHFGGPTTGNVLADELIMMVLAGIVIGLHWNIFKRGYHDLFHGHPGMETLVALASTISFVHGVVVTGFTIAEAVSGAELTQRMVFFESSAMVIVLVSVGKLLENKAKERTSSSLESLFSLMPENALVKRDGDFVERPISEIKKGDLIRVLPGESVPTDGRIVDGYGYLEESMVSGEPVPKYLKAGDPVVSGSLNRTGSFSYEATAPANESTIEKIATLVEDASRSKGHYAEIADKVSAVFTPIILAIAIATFLGWYFTGHSLDMSLNFAMSVLVISCPCALGLATPTAIMAGSGVGASRGILIKSASAYEKMSKVTTLAFDKTGTLTTGHLKVDGETLYEDDPKALRDAIYSLEQRSPHPLAMTMCHHLSGQGAAEVKVSSFEDVPGKGLKGTVDGVEYLIGNKALMPEGLDLPAQSNKRASVIYVAKKKGDVYRLSAFYELVDELKPEVKATLASLKKKGYELVLISGDNEAATNWLAEEVGIEKAYSNVRPEDKERIVKELQSQGKRVLMTGDGINDAPALKSADIGVAVGSGTNLAVESADVILMRSDLRDLEDAITLSKKVAGTIKGNLIYAFVYNVIAIPIAAGALYYALNWSLNPSIGAAIMSISSLCVVLNALRIKRVRFHEEDKNMDKKIVFGVEGMMCAHCVAHIEEAMKGIQGVKEAKASLDSKSVEVVASRDIADDEAKKAIEGAGYTFSGRVA
jgi:heavy metal translocating P-type ATPase